MQRRSSHRFRSTQVRLALILLAHNPGSLRRRLTLLRRIENWSLTSLQQRLLKLERCSRVLLAERRLSHHPHGSDFRVRLHA